MNVYQLLKFNRYLKNHRIKFLGIWLLHKLNKRYLAVNFDPVMACNLRCKMCYFTDENYVRKLKGIFPEEDLERLADVFFGRALKLQIGCGTEPTLYKQLSKIVALGKKKKVPYISLTTNANLLNKELIRDLVIEGLDEFTISLHGVHKEEYEEFMGKASYEKFSSALNEISNIKKEFPNLKLRINYTFNKDNFYSLNHFFDNFGKFKIDVLQIRPIKKIGETEYNNFDISSLSNDYDAMIANIEKECFTRGITLLANKSFNSLTKENNLSSFIYNYTYCYISPRHFWKKDFDWKNESFNEFSKKINWSKDLLSKVFKSKEQMLELESKLSLNYDIIE